MKKLAISVLGALLLSSCAHYYYVPNVQNVPLFREKNEYRFSAFYGAGDMSSSGEVQAAYSATNHLGLMANYLSAKGQTSANRNSAKGYCLEGAAGYFKPFGNAAVFEIYGGLGGGSQHHEYYNMFIEKYDGTADLTCIKVFIQPSLGLTFKAFDIAFSTRMSRMTFTDVNNNITNSFKSNMLNDIDNKSHFFIEPALTLRAGWKNVKFQLQGQISTEVSNPTLYIGEGSHLSAGMYFTIANRYKSNETNNSK
jgi:hypothetical protein